MASGWEFVGAWVPGRLGLTFDPRLPKKIMTKKFPANVPSMQKNYKVYLKKIFKNKTYRAKF